MQQVVEEGEVVRLAGERAPNLGVSEVAPAEYSCTHLLHI